MRKTIGNWLALLALWVYPYPKEATPAWDALAATPEYTALKEKL